MADRNSFDDLLLEEGQKQQDEALGKVGELCAELELTRDEISSLEHKLKKLKETEQDLSSKQVPDALAAAGLSGVKMPSGKSVMTKESWKASVPNPETARDKDAAIERAKRILDWVTANGGASIIKHQIHVPLGPREADKASIILEAIEKAGFRAVNLETIHPQTLGSWLGQKEESGVDIPENLGAYKHVQTIIK